MSGDSNGNGGGQLFERAAEHAGLKLVARLAIIACSLFLAVASFIAHKAWDTMVEVRDTTNRTSWQVGEMKKTQEGIKNAADRQDQRIRRIENALLIRNPYRPDGGGNHDGEEP